MLPAGLLRLIRSLPKPFDYAKEQLEQARWKWKEASNQFEKDGWYAFLRRQGNLPSPILPWERLEPEDDEGYEGTGLTQQDADFIKTLAPESVRRRHQTSRNGAKTPPPPFPVFGVSSPIATSPSASCTAVRVRGTTASALSSYFLLPTEKAARERCCRHAN